MSIWQEHVNLEDINNRSQNTLAAFLGVKFSEIGDDYIKATMPVNDRTKQPIGILHGGANVVLAETLASTAANCVINIDIEYCVGLEINANHIRSVTSGLVEGITHPLHLGRRTQVWQIDIFNTQGKLSCSSRMTAAVIQR
jgi:1,4-dihydroxy-2-naphthoyl-CoA hydrolase